MTILADSQIKQLCTPPNFVITTNVPANNSSGLDVYYLPNPVQSFSYMTEDEIKKEINKSYNSYVGTDEKSVTGIVKYRHLFQEEIDQFKPMINPYVDGQVRTQLRNPTAHELQVWEQARHSGYVPEHFISDNVDVGLQIKEKIISYGTSSYGYDVRIANEFKIFTNVNSTVLDPKDFNDKSFVDFIGDVCIIPPNSFVLARTLEKFIMPNDVTGLVLGKSTYARLGISCLATPIEAGWAGEIVLEFANTTPLPVKLYANEGAAQLLFFKGEQRCDVSYADRGGKYQNQSGIQTALV